MSKSTVKNRFLSKQLKIKQNTMKIEPRLGWTFFKLRKLVSRSWSQSWLCPFNHTYYMASSVSGRDELNPVLWLATREGKKTLPCQLGITCCLPQENSVLFPYNKYFIDQACSVKMTGYWPHSFCACVCGPQLHLGHKHAKKELGQ